jgi:predicted nucleic acid-binding protein
VGHTNASPLILFAPRIGRLDLLERLAPKIIVPNAVLDEVRVGQEKDATATMALLCQRSQIVGHWNTRRRLALEAVRPD